MTAWVEADSLKEGIRRMKDGDSMTPMDREVDGDD